MPAILAVALLLVPVAEIVVAVQVAQAIGGWRTFGLLVLGSLVGAWLVRREGVRAWRALRGSVRSGGLPSRELLDGALILIGGALILFPGFLTDIVGFLLVLPFTRPLVRAVLGRALARRVARLAGAASIGHAVVPGEVVPGEAVPGEVRRGTVITGTVLPPEPPRPGERGPRTRS